MICGLLGRKLGHSYSPQIHAQLGSYCYELFEKEPEEIEGFLKKGNFSGLNVTIPYKKAVIPYLDELSPAAQKIGAVNTVVRQPNGKLIGHNTDYFGFRYLLQKSGTDVQGKKVLVLGSGGASNTAVAVLRQLGADAVVISRTGENNYQNISLHADASVIVNATPVGMYPENGRTPVSLDHFPHLEGVLDVIYNPARTAFLLDAESRGLPAMNGLRMLVAQAKESAEWFTGEKIADSLIETIYHDLQLQMQNIILIGMPGCGKTTIGQMLAERLHKDFFDADDVLEQNTGRPITEIIPQDGEAAFRLLETQTLAQLGKRSGLVIATGGGCVTQDRNYPLLHQNGSIFWLKRELNRLPTEGRPLSRPGKLAEMYAVREPMYRRFADAEISNNASVENAVDGILHILEGTK